MTWVNKIWCFFFAKTYDRAYHDALLDVKHNIECETTSTDREFDTGYKVVLGMLDRDEYVNE